MIEEIGTCAEFSPDGQYLMLGTSQGNVYIKSKQSETFNSTPLVISQKKKDIKCENIKFSNCGSYFAISDSMGSISFFSMDHKYDDEY